MPKHYQFLDGGPIEGGRITVYAPPPDDCYCALGLDSCLQALPDGDYDFGCILDARGEQLLSVQGHWGVRFADVLWPIVQWYNPFVVGERSAQGLTTLRALYDRGYTWLYWNRKHESRGMNRTDCLGHNPTENDITLQMLRAAIAPRNDAGLLEPSLITVRDEVVHHQLTVFQFIAKSKGVAQGEATDAQVKMGAPPGEHDDGVRALAYAWAGVKWLPQFEKPEPKFPPMSMGAMFGTPATLAKQKAHEQKKAFTFGK
jgi:hypothetical protein